MFTRSHLEHYEHYEHLEHLNAMNMNDLKFDRKRTRVKNCPCGKSNRDGKFVPFTNFEDKGYCHSCCQTFLPEVERIEKPIVIQPEPPPSFISPDLFKASLKAYEQNTFAQFLANRFGVKETERAIAKYFIGSTKDGGTVFWQIDTAGNIRSGKIIHYDETGHRLKDVSPVWAHSELKISDFNLKQCLFGTHLLRGNTKPVAIVESEKTAIIASIYFPEKLWLASGGKNGLQTAKMEALKGHTVTLFPDLDGFEMWTQRADELSPMLNIIRVSRLLEDNATQSEREGKLDLADYLLRFDPKDFNKQPEQEFAMDGTPIGSKGYPISWDITMSPIQKIITKNPAVAELIKRLDLIQLN